MSMIRCPCCGAEFFLREEAQAELPLGPIALAKKNKLDTQEQISHARRPGARFESVRSSSSLTESESNRVIASCEEDLIESVREIVGEKEWRAHSPLWRCYFQSCPRAIHDAVDDWKDLTPDKRRAIRNRPGWMTDRFKRARDRIAREQTRKRAS